MDDDSLADIESKISEIVKGDLYGRFPTGFVFDPVRVYPRTDEWGNDYLKIFIIYDGNGDDLNAEHTVGLMTRLKPKLRELNINDDIADGFVEKSEWDSLTRVPFL